MEAAYQHPPVEQDRELVHHRAPISNVQGQREIFLNHPLFPFLLGVRNLLVRIYSTGIDLVEVRAFAILLERGGDDFARRCFSAEELDVAGSGKMRAARLAGCFAAKEAVLKALGTGWTGGIALNEVVINAASTSSPTVTLTGAALDVAREAGVTSWLISISLAGGTALASAVACSDQGPGPRN